MSYPTELEGLLAQAEAAVASAESESRWPSPSARRALELRPALAQLAAPPSTCCAKCPSALWMVGTAGPEGYCRQMHVLVFSAQEQNHFSDCDGLYQDIEE